jgi:hypothetical protein
LTLLASLTRQELARQATYLKAENAILRSKLPDRITLNNQERRRLVRHGITPPHRPVVGCDETIGVPTKAN